MTFTFNTRLSKRARNMNSNLNRILKIHKKWKRINSKKEIEDDGETQKERNSLNSHGRI